jgi:hypothetical protein
MVIFKLVLRYWKGDLLELEELIHQLPGWRPDLSGSSPEHKRAGGAVH